MEIGEGEREWKATEEEEEAEAAEELSGGELEIRQRKKGKMGRESEEEKVGNGEENSVCLEADTGLWKCRHCSWTYHLSGPGRDVIQKHEGSCQMVMDVETLTQLGTYIDSPIKGADVNDGTVGLKLGETDKFVSEKSPQNGIADNGAKEFNNHNNVPVEEQNHKSRNAVTGNGSHSHLISEKMSANGSTGIENEIQEYKQLIPGESSKFVGEEFDVERVLEEQETHDLYCPNCHSCITKRVILRKRKRTLQENPSDLPPQKVPHVHADHEDMTVFRCLSCFSFFIPTEGGFNIFRIFGKRDGSANLQSSEKKPARNVNWVSSIFGSGSSKKEGTEEGVSLLAESSTVSSGDSSSGTKKYSPPIPTSETADLGEKGAISGMDNAGVPLHAEAITVSSGDSSMGSKEFPPPIHTSGTADHGEIGAICGMINKGENISKPVSMIKPTPTSPGGITEGNQNIHGPDSPAVETHINVGEPGIEQSRRNNDWDVLKSIVYGGLIESITSLVVVSSAAGTGSSTLNICALGLANLIGGLFIIAHDLSELRSAHDAEATNQREEQAGRYWEKLGKREHFRRHVVLSILSYIIFGLLPPVIYGFAFRESDNKEYKLIAVAASSLLCVALLAIGKAHVRPQKDYIKSFFYYLGIAVAASGLSYVAGVMIDRLLVELGLFVPNTLSPSPPASIELVRLSLGTSAYASL